MPKTSSNRPLVVHFTFCCSHISKNFRTYCNMQSSHDEYLPTIQQQYLNYLDKINNSWMCVKVFGRRDNFRKLVCTLYVKRQRIAFWFPSLPALCSAKPRGQLSWNVRRLGKVRENLFTLLSVSRSFLVFMNIFSLTHTCTLWIYFHMGPTWVSLYFYESDVGKAYLVR